MINNFNKLKTNFKRKISTKPVNLALLRTKETSFQEPKLEKHFQIILQMFNQFKPNWVNNIKINIKLKMYYQKPMLSNLIFKEISKEKGLLRMIIRNLCLCLT